MFKRLRRSIFCTPGVRRGFCAASLLAATGVAPVAIADDRVPQAPNGQVEPSCSGLTCFLQKLRGEPLSPSTPAVAVQAPSPPSAASTEPSKATAATATRRQTTTTLSIASEAADPARLHYLVKTLSRANIRTIKGRDEKADGAIKLSFEDHRAGDLDLYSDQVHIVARNSIKSVADLNGRLVSFGVEPEARALAQKAFAALAVSVNETPLDYNNALDGLASGDIDAVVAIVPPAAPELVALKGSSVHLIDWPSSVPAPEDAAIDRLPAASYPGLIAPGESVAALHVHALFRASDVGRRHGADRLLHRALTRRRDELARQGLVVQLLSDDSRGHLASNEQR